MKPGEWLRAVRKAKGFTKAQVARRLETTAYDVTGWESDFRLNPLPVWRLRWYIQQAGDLPELQQPPDEIRFMVELCQLSSAVERVLTMREEMRRMKHLLERSRNAMVIEDLHPKFKDEIVEGITMLLDRLEQGRLL